MNKKIFIIQFLTGSTFLWIFLWMRYSGSFAPTDYYFWTVFKLGVPSKSTSNRNINYNATIIQTDSKIALEIPNGLWHSRETNPGNGRVDRIQAQRKWVENLSTFSERISIKNILIVMRESTYTFNILPCERQPHCQMCPPEFQYNISSKCNFVRLNSSRLASVNISAYDAVVSAVNSIDRYENRVWKSNSGPPHVYVTGESPVSPYVPSVNLFTNNKILASYWSNSDIPIPYGAWIPESNITKYTLPKNETLDKKKNYAKGKTKLIAMLVSNCKDTNGRLKYALELRKYLTVDIYGNCSPERKKCNPNCFKILKEDYKFYLAFENANCRDYITEKLFRNAFQNDVVPIVMGAHSEDYKAVAPPHSYIHVEDFVSPKALAEYLVRVNKNDDLYNEYFKWKNTGQFIETHKDIFCRICAMIIYSDFKPKPAWPKHATIKTENKCLNRSVWYWNH